jgi:hypothetical protein
MLGRIPTLAMLDQEHGWMVNLKSEWYNNILIVFLPTLVALLLSEGLQLFIC